LKRSDGTITGPALDGLFEFSLWYCQLCGQHISPETERGNPLALHWDHRDPLSLGGAHSISNLRPTHARCNLRRRTLMGDAEIDAFLEPMFFPEDLEANP
jgi:hypothetical protein